MRQSWIGTLALIVSVAACGSEPAGPGGPLGLTVTTDKPAYSLATDSVALVTLTNRSDRPVYLPMGIYVVYERFRGANGATPLPGSSLTALDLFSHLLPGPRKPTTSHCGPICPTSRAPTDSGTSSTRTRR